MKKLVFFLISLYAYNLCGQSIKPTITASKFLWESECCLTIVDTKNIVVIKDTIFFVKEEKTKSTKEILLETYAIVGAKELSYDRMTYIYKEPKEALKLFRTLSGSYEENILEEQLLQNPDVYYKFVLAHAEKIRKKKKK